jgi:hypothetical protein
MPGITESSTVEWQSAHVTPRRVMWLFASTVACRPTTAFILSSATVVAGLLRSTVCRMPAASIRIDLQSDASAVVGSTCCSTTSCMRS